MINNPSLEIASLSSPKNAREGIRIILNKSKSVDINEIAKCGYNNSDIKNGSWFVIH
jgi:hypothetical protein